MAVFLLAKVDLSKTDKPLLHLIGIPLFSKIAKSIWKETN